MVSRQYLESCQRQEDGTYYAYTTEGEWHAADDDMSGFLPDGVTRGPQDYPRSVTVIFDGAGKAVAWCYGHDPATATFESTV